MPPPRSSAGARTGLEREGPSESHMVGLVRRVADGSAEALEELYRLVEQPVYGLALRLLRDEKASEEAVVEVFQRIWTRAASFDPERGRVFGWVLTITRSVALESLRARRRDSERAVGLSAELAHELPGPLHQAQSEETTARVDAALRALPNEQQRVLRAAFFGGLSYREVAEVLGQPIGTVKTRIRAGLTALRRSLAPEGEFA